MLEQHYEQLRQHIQEVNTLRLEFVQEMENLQDLMHTDQTKLKLCGKILEEAKFRNAVFFCNHQVTNLILARYQKLAAKRNIQITFQADLPEELPINDDDLAQLLIHALEHSFRETHAIENPLYRKFICRYTNKRNISSFVANIVHITIQTYLVEASQKN